jgi:hypothetical protein
VSRSNPANCSPASMAHRAIADRKQSEDDALDGGVDGDAVPVRSPWRTGAHADTRLESISSVLDGTRVGLEPRRRSMATPSE